MDLNQNIKLKIPNRLQFWSTVDLEAHKDCFDSIVKIYWQSEAIHVDIKAAFFKTKYIKRNQHLPRVLLENECNNNPNRIVHFSCKFIHVMCKAY